MLRVDRPSSCPTLLVLASFSLVACGHRERDEDHADQIASSASPEPLTVRRGQRTIDVRCERSCGPAQVELSRLQRSCVRDPSSNVHHVTERPAMIELGCCSEARSVVAEACGDEGSMAGCLDRWVRHCERGELLELDEPADDHEDGS